MLAWAPPAAGDSAVGGYAWVEYVGGTPVLSGDAIDAARMWDNASLYARIGGFRKGYGILPGAIVAYNRGGFSPVSEPWARRRWEARHPRRPPLRVRRPWRRRRRRAAARVAGARVDGGYPVASYEVSLQKWDESAARWRGVEGHDGVVVDAPPPNASAAAAAAAAPAPAAAEAAAAAAAEVVHVIDEAMAAGEYRFRVTALNSQGDESARATSDSAAVPGGWCGWEGRRRPRLRRRRRRRRRRPCARARRRRRRVVVAAAPAARAHRRGARRPRRSRRRPPRAGDQGREPHRRAVRPGAPRRRPPHRRRRRRRLRRARVVARRRRRRRGEEGRGRGGRGAAPPPRHCGGSCSTRSSSGGSSRCSLGEHGVT